MGKEKDTSKEKSDRRRARFWKMMTGPVEAWLKVRFSFEHDDFRPEVIDGPVLVCINHASAYDPLFVGAVFKNKRLTFIASEHILRSKWGPFLDKYGSIIPHRKGARASRTALIAMKRIKRGESVFLAPEGEQTWDGRPLPVMPYTGRLVKGSGATLVTYMIEGGYLSAPRWAMSTRKGKVYSHAVNIYGPERLREMSDEEVEAAIASDLAFDTWEWQKSQHGGPVKYKCRKRGNACGLERSVFTCPSCGRMDALRSAGDYINCGCGFRLRLADTGFFEPCREDGPSDAFSDGCRHFETVRDWEASDRKALEEALEDLKRRSGERPGMGSRGSASEDSPELFGDDDVTLLRIEDGHRETEAARGRLALIYKEEKFLLTIGGKVFETEGISDMTMVLAARIVFSDKNGYYELKSAKGSMTNLRKYVIARDLIKGIVKE